MVMWCRCPPFSSGNCSTRRRRDGVSAGNSGNSLLSVDLREKVNPAGEQCKRSDHWKAPRSRSPCCSRAASVTSPPSLSNLLDTTRSLPSSRSTLLRQQLNLLGPPLLQDSASPKKDDYTELYPQSYVERLQAQEGTSAVNSLSLEDRNVYFSPVVEMVSCFKPSRYNSSLLPQENKPLEVGILRRVKELLAEVDPRMAAKHITKTDCMVARILEVTPEMKRKMGVSSGMELLTLPHGQQLRMDLLERFQTMATMLAVNVLGCTGTTEERAALLHKIIQIAVELKTTMGNMFGFAAVMRALELPQVRETDWISIYDAVWLTLFMEVVGTGKGDLTSNKYPLG
ncbi:hypothetical protein ILYODFUR_029864 [Ilyodon furcidens]|uniref:Ras-GEF domain-containing protein n=1 Tax=Ilyodon furcidens TaxID=33524 RepID=A0ABV0UWJ4_9TELE